LHHFQVDAFHDEPTRKAMAQIVPSKIGYSGTLYRRLPTVLDIANRFASQLTFKMGKDVLGIAAFLL